MAGRSRKINLKLAGLLFFLAFPASATVIRVPQDQPTIQAGINAAVSGDTVLVFPGTYFENIHFLGKGLLVISDSGPAVTTITNSDTGAASIIAFDSNETRQARLKGFTIKGGRNVNNGGGILCAANCSPTIEGNVIEDNIAGEGSGIYIEGPSSPLIQRNIIINNNDDGIKVVSNSTAEIINNVISNNVARGILLGGGNPTIKNNILMNHSLGIEGTTSIPPSYNCFFANYSAPYVGTLGPGNLITDPLFVGGIPYDYHLQLSSPCIDAGDPATPVPPFGGFRVDIGAFELHHIANPLVPINGGTLLVRQPSFIWRKNVDSTVSTVYRVFIDTTINFVLPDSSPLLTDTTWKIPYRLILGQHYFWKIEAIIDNADTIISNTSNFLVRPIVTLISPVDSSRVLVKRPTFDWQAVRDTSIPDNFTYRIVYSKDPSFTSANSSPILTDSFWHSPAPLDIATTYYWKALAYYSVANDSLQSPVFSFLLAPSTLFVPGDRPTIQQAIDIALSDDTVLVLPGTYFEHVHFRGKRVKLHGWGGAKVTIIKKLVDGVQLIDLSGTPVGAELSGFTLTGARSVSVGAAIKCDNSSYALIENNYILDNTGDAGAVWIRGGRPILSRNLIAENVGEAAIRFFDNASQGEITNCTIANNTGDGIRVEPGMVVSITNTIMAFNSQYGIKSVGGADFQVEINFNDNFGNSLGTYFGVLPSTGNISQNPQFLAGNPFDYRLSSASPCIDSGDSVSSVPQGGGARIDIGAFEFVPKLGDLNGDGTFSPTDVVLELNCVFLGTGNCNLEMADLNCDSQLSPADVVLILNFVFLGNPPPC